ncbi:GNAT family N-acetyltransferase [Butyricicoccus sp.]|uniref:GNAT family N-acetyltransferase n=1 Tax=Butyricicoccus sp. TaxID=2049021 RepID=UPI0037365D81
MGTIRRAEARDLDRLKDIYNDAVVNTTATFDLEPKDDADRRTWFDAHQGRHVLLVYETDSGELAGYASLSRYRERAAFDKTVELSVYLHPDFRGQHIGAQLMQAVLGYAWRCDNIETVVSLITSDNEASIHLHEKLGFSYCGQIRNAGVKFGKRLHLNIYELTFI